MSGRQSKRSKQIEKPLPESELRAILRAADDIIAEGGRTLLSKILKGSREKKLLELGLDQNPAYGFYKGITLEQITDKIDHMIRTGYLQTQYQDKLPMIVFTPLGWAIERERRAAEFLQEWDFWIAHHISPISMEYLKERNRGMILLFLYKILCTGDTKYMPLLTVWENNAYKKVKAEIANVKKALMRRDQMNDLEWEQLKHEYARILIVRSKDPLITDCQQCGGLNILDEANPDYYTKDGLRFPDVCRRCED